MALYDANGDLIKSVSDKQPLLARVAVPTMRDKFLSYPSNGLNPRRLAEIFREADDGYVLRQMELFTELEEKDARIASALATRKRTVQGLKWEIIPAAERGKDPTPDQQKIADCVEEILSEVKNFDEWIFDALDAIGKGYSISEILWKISEREYRIDELVWCDPRKFVWDTTNYQEEPRLQTAKDMLGVPISAYPGAFVYHRYKARSGKPSRAGMLRTCAWMYLFKNYSIKDWMTFAEVYGMPLRLGKFDPGASEQEKDILRQALLQLGADGAGIISKNAEIEFVSAAEKGSSSDLYNDLITLANNEITLAILGQLASSQGEAGRLGNNDSQENVRQDLLESDAKSLGKTIRQQIIVRLVDFNFGPQDRYPDFKFAYEPPEDQKAKAELLTTLSNAGVPIPVSHVRKAFEIPEADDDEGIVIPWSARQPPQASAADKEEPATEDDPTTDDPAAAAAKQSATTATNSVDQVVEEMMGDWQKVLDPLVGELLRRIDAATSFEEVRQVLVEAAKDQSVSIEALNEILAAGQMAGRALGDKEVAGGN